MGTFYRAFRALSTEKFSALAFLALRHPLFFLLSSVATVRAFRIARRLFPESSSGNGIGNAFRHALWTCLIMMYCCKVSSPEKARQWTQKITGLHEDLFPNPPAERAMDLHNNRVGIALFMELLPGIHRQFFETSFLIEAVMVKLSTAKPNVPPQMAGEELVFFS